MDCPLPLPLCHQIISLPFTAANLFHCNIVFALAGVSSTNAALRGFLPDNMKQLLNDKLAAVKNEDTCNAFANIEDHPCDATADCYEDSGLTLSSCPMTCNHIGMRFLRNATMPGKYCRANDGSEEEDNEIMKVKELLNNKFAAIKNEDTCNAFANVEDHPCVATADCYADSGLTLSSCPMTCNHIGMRFLRNATMPGKYCRANDGSEEEDADATN